MATTSTSHTTKKKRNAVVIDLTQDSDDAASVQRPVKRKRSAPVETSTTDHASSSIGKRTETMKTKDAKGGNFPSMPKLTNPPIPKEEPKDEEKRLSLWRDQAPASYYAIRHRALSQRMFAINRFRGGTSEHPTETVEMAGSTGNVYTVTIDKICTCDCPAAIYNRGNPCKHVAYVLARVLHAPEHLQYQLALVTAELRDIFAKAPDLATASPEGNGKRKEVEGDCPICCCEFEIGREKIVYCRASCGNNVHEGCFDKWAATRGRDAVTCPYCRSPWQRDGGPVRKVSRSGTINHEGYVNVGSELGLPTRRG